MAFSGAEITRLGVSGYPRGLYGSFAGKGATAVAPTVLGYGYTPWAPISETEIRRQRDRLKRDRRRLHRQLEKLLYPETAKPARKPRRVAKEPTEAIAAPEPVEAATELPQVDLAAIEARQALLMEIDTELERLAEQLTLAREQEEENTLLTILLLTAD